MLDIFTLKRKVIRWFDEPKPVTPADLERMNIHELFAVCNSEPAHVEIAPWDVIPDARPTYDQLVRGAKFTEPHRAEVREFWNDYYSDANVRARMEAAATDTK